MGKAIIYFLFAAIVLMPLRYIIPGMVNDPIQEASAAWNGCGGPNNNTCTGLSEANCGLAAPCCSWEPTGGGGGHVCKKVACSALGADCHTCGCNMMCDYNCHAVDDAHTTSTDACDYVTPGTCESDPCCNWVGPMPGGGCEPRTCTGIDTENCSTTCGCNDDWVMNDSEDVCAISTAREVFGVCRFSDCTKVHLNSTGDLTCHGFTMENKSGCTIWFTRVAGSKFHLVQ